jgi:hypothetical protein
MLEPDQRDALLELTEICKTDPTTDWLSENHKIRYLRGWNWNAQKAFEGIIAAEEIRAGYEADRITREEIQSCINFNCYAHLGYDQCGRPVIYAKLRNIRIADVTL